jgi:CheY-like chemotaxis protein
MNRNRLRILLVEDYPDCAESTALLLGLWGHEYAIARDGTSALQAVQVYCPDVVLLDIGLPGDMDGWALAGNISRRPEERPLLIAVTGFGQDADKRRSAECGIYFHLTKPIDPGQLKDLLDAWWATKSRPAPSVSGPGRCLPPPDAPGTPAFLAPSGVDRRGDGPFEQVERVSAPPPCGE